MPVSQTTVRRASATTSGVAPFLTRPYWNPHDVTSVFDHCAPDYTRDGRICEFDGVVAASGNGVDPTFTAGYAITPGGTDYLYYDGHNGWDLALNYEPLLAAAPGTVAIAGSDPYNPGFGQTVTVDHGNGFTTRYAHMSQVWVSSGQHVDRGQQIGVSGNTGASTGPHLHFGLYITNPWTAIDPWGWTGGSADPWPADSGNYWLTGNPQNPVPWAPTNAVASSSAGGVQVSWAAPGFDGGSPISSYVVTASPGGATTTVAGSSTSANVTGLSTGTTYTFTVKARNATGEGPESAPSNGAAPGYSTPLAVSFGPLPASSASSGFDVSWSSASASRFDLFASDNGGAFKAWVLGTNATTKRFYGLPGHGYQFRVTAYRAIETATATSSSVTVAATAVYPGLSPADNQTRLYTLDGYGGLHQVGPSPVLTSPDYMGGRDVARGLALFADGAGGYWLDGFGGLHQVGNAPPLTGSAGWPWDIARGVTLAPWSTAANPAGWVLDGWGGIHQFGDAPPVLTPGWWENWDIARGLVVLPDSTPASVSGYLLDGYGGIHPFGGAPPVAADYFGRDLARGLALLPRSTSASPAGYVIDGYGVVHRFGSAADPQVDFGWRGWDIAKSVTTWTGASAGSPGGWVLDGFGGVHAFGSAPQLPPSGYWNGWDIARTTGGAGSGNGAKPAAH
jgi:hypothetical protein